MAYKNIQQQLSFADIALKEYADKNRSLLFLRQINETIDWMPVQELLLKHYTIGKAGTGEKAYPPLLLFKCLLLQKWFRIQSDPELESQINDRLSFKSFLEHSMDCPSPDHSTFSRFRARLSKKAMTCINNVLLQQFHQHGLAINAGMAIDARLVKSASRPLSKEQLEKLKEKEETPAKKQIKKHMGSVFPGISTRTGRLKMTPRITD